MFAPVLSLVPCGLGGTGIPGAPLRRGARGDGVWDAFGRGPSSPLVYVLHMALA